MDIRNFHHHGVALSLAIDPDPMQRVGVKEKTATSGAEQTLNTEEWLHACVIETGHVVKTIPVVSHAIAASGDLCVKAILDEEPQNRIHKSRRVSSFVQNSTSSNTTWAPQIIL